MPSKIIFMCDPSAFGVEYSINPWMVGNYHAVDKALAASQWSDLLVALRAAGAIVRVISGSPATCPDATFIANAGLLINDTLWLSRFRFIERSSEEAFFEQRFNALHFQVTEVLSPAASRLDQSFEGAGDALFSPNRKVLWLGTGFRTSPGISATLNPLINRPDIELIELELLNPLFYHLDTCFCPLDSGHTLWYPDAFSASSQRLIRQRLGTSGIELTPEDAYGFSANAVSVGTTVVLPKSSVTLSQRLWDLGYHPVQLDMSEFMKAGGACKCLTLETVTIRS